MLSEPGSQHIVRLLDDFSHVGPNGVHTCVVLELLGPNIPAVIEAQFADARLPGAIAKRTCKEVLLALAFLHEHRIGHGGKWSSLSCCRHL